MLLLKLLLVAVSVLLSTLAARRYGHAAGGAVAGMPMIAGPIVAVLLVDLQAEQVRAIALGTLMCVPAAIAHIVAFAHAARRVRWPGALAIALGVYLAAAAALTHAALPPAAACVLALFAPSLGLWAAPRSAHQSAAVAMPGAEFVLRIGAAVAMALVIVLGADRLPPAVSGLLLAVPITGSVLPCFTLPRHGPEATVALLGGFMRGLHGFAAFFVAVYLALGAMGKLEAFSAALAAAFMVAALVQLTARRAAQ
jgi:hypothetical protein